MPEATAAPLVHIGTAIGRLLHRCRDLPDSEIETIAEQIEAIEADLQARHAGVAR